MTYLSEAIQGVDFAKNSTALRSLLEKSTLRISCLGCRQLYVTGYEGSISLDKVAKTVSDVSRNSNLLSQLSNQARVDGAYAAVRIATLYEEMDKEMQNSNCFTRLVSWIRELVAKCFGCCFSWFRSVRSDFSPQAVKDLSADKTSEKTTSEIQGDSNARSTHWVGYAIPAAQRFCRYSEKDFIKNFKGTHLEPDSLTRDKVGDFLDAYIGSMENAAKAELGMREKLEEEATSDKTGHAVPLERVHGS